MYTAQLVQSSTSHSAHSTISAGQACGASACCGAGVAAAAASSFQAPLGQCACCWLFRRCPWRRRPPRAPAQWAAPGRLVSLHRGGPPRGRPADVGKRMGERGGLFEAGRKHRRPGATQKQKGNEGERTEPCSSPPAGVEPAAKPNAAPSQVDATRASDLSDTPICIEGLRLGRCVCSASAASRQCRSKHANRSDAPLAPPCCPRPAPWRRRPLPAQTWRSPRAPPAGCLATWGRVGDEGALGGSSWAAGPTADGRGEAAAASSPCTPAARSTLMPVPGAAGSWGEACGALGVERDLLARGLRLLAAHGCCWELLKARQSRVRLRAEKQERERAAAARLSCRRCAPAAGLMPATAAHCLLCLLRRPPSLITLRPRPQQLRCARGPPWTAKAPRSSPQRQQSPSACPPCLPCPARALGTAGHARQLPPQLPWPAPSPPLAARHRPPLTALPLCLPSPTAQPAMLSDSSPRQLVHLHDKRLHQASTAAVRERGALATRAADQTPDASRHAALSTPRQQERPSHHPDRHASRHAGRSDRRNKARACVHGWGCGLAAGRMTAARAMPSRPLSSTADSPLAEPAQVGRGQEEGQRTPQPARALRRARAEPAAAAASSNGLGARRLAVTACRARCA